MMALIRLCRFLGVYATVILVMLPGRWVVATSDFNITEARRSVVFIKRFTPKIAPTSGSGFIVRSDGLIYTNRHVVVPLDNLEGSVIYVGVPSVDDPDTLNYFEAKTVFATEHDDPLDFAVLKIAADPDYGQFPTIPQTFEKLRLGNDVAVIGYPFVSDNLPVLSFNKGSISSTRVPIHGKSYYQTDAAINPGNSGGPLLNTAGRVIGIVTLKNPFADNMGYAVYLSETKPVMDVIAGLAKSIDPPAGQVDTRLAMRPPTITPKIDHWQTRHAQVKQEQSHLLLHRGGAKYWVTSQSELPEDFQLTIRCQVRFYQGRQMQYGGANSMRIICIAFGTPETDQNILKSKGYLLQFSGGSIVLTKNGKLLKGVREGNVNGRCALTITKQGGDITFALNDRILLEHHDDDPIPGRHRFRIGGYLSKIHLGGVSILDLGDRS